MRFGIHALALVPAFDTDQALVAVETAAKVGYDVLELPLFDPGAADLRTLRKALERAGLGVTCSLGLRFDQDLSAAGEPGRAGETLLGEVVDAAGELGAELVGGVIFSAMGKYAAPATEADRDRAAAALGRLARRARPSGVRLALEVVNRYESNLVNTVGDALELIERIGEPNVVVHLDSYHMHIEEPDMVRPVLAAGERLGYVHVGESNRGHLGTGQVRLAELFSGLELGGYDGIVTFEAFTRSRVSPELMGALALWRDTFADPVELAERALATMRSLSGAAADAGRACPGRLGSPPPGTPDGQD